MTLISIVTYMRLVGNIVGTFELLWTSVRELQARIGQTDVRTNECNA